MTDDLLVSRDNGIVTLTFNRPWARNALTFAMYEGLAGLCAQIDADESIRALVLIGAGDEAFASGTDISQFRDFADDYDAMAYEAMIERVLRALEGCRVPVIGALAGACTGGGAMIASCCDLRIGAPNLKFGFPIARTLGNCLSAENLARLVALLGEARVKDLLFSARLAGAEEALATGFITRIVADPPALAVAVHELARDVASNAPLTLLATKRALARQRLQAVPAGDLLLLCYRSHDFREGLAAFAEKRKPVWTGR